MSYLILGTIAFLLFIIYDINEIIWKRKWLRYNFFIGCGLLIISTIGIIDISKERILPLGTKTFFYGSISFLFLLLLIYTLFFALPFHDTYVKNNAELKVYQDGVYALCRHPGILWFIGFYLFLWLTLSHSLALIATVLFSTLNIFYAAFQDKWSFVKTFHDYNNYKKTTPFLIPNRASISRFVKSILRERRTKNEI